MALRSVQEVEDWVAKNGIEELRKAVHENRFTQSSQALATAWLKRHDEEASILSDLQHKEAERRRGERAADAAERSAAAAERSADASVHANRIAWLALLVALAALAVAAWPYITASS